MTLFIILAALWAASGIGAWFCLMRGADKVTIGDLLAIIGTMILGPVAALIAAIELGAFDFLNRVVWRRK